MRKELQQIGEETRNTFTGRFERYGEKSGYMGHVKETVLLLDIRNSTGKIVADHLWFNRTKGFRQLTLKQGDIVQFDARVEEYERGYHGRREYVYVPVSTDYKLAYPTKIVRLEDGN